MTATSFSADGKLIATFSLEENTVKFWQPASGLFGALVGAFGSVGMPGSGLGGAHNNPGLLTLKMFRSFNLGGPRGSFTVNNLPLSNLIRATANFRDNRQDQV